METLGEKEGKREQAWTTHEIRKNSANWTLAGDVGLFNLLEEFSHNIISQTHQVENSIDALVHKTKMASIKINNTINDFHMLSNLQFVENRVYDEGVQEVVPEEKAVVEKTKEQKEAEMLPKIKTAVELGLVVLEQSFDKINVNEISDSDDEDLSSEGRTILEPKDPYEFRPLPFIIGSAEFQNCDYAGLKDLILEEIESSPEEESMSESDETSDEGELLPQDDNKFSAVRNPKAQSISDRMSSSDESELFGSEKEENGFVSDSSFESKTKEGKHVQQSDVEIKVEEKEKRQNSVSSLQSKLNLPQVLPVPKKDDLFTNNDEMSDDDSPFQKSRGLFSSNVHFGDEKEDMFGDDLFKGSAKEYKEEPKPESVKPKKKTPPASKVSKQLDLFGNEDSDEDIFNTLMKSKTPVSKGINAGGQDLSEKAESSSTPSSAPSSKPSGNAFDFVTGSGHADSLFGDESDADDLFSNKKNAKSFDFHAFDEDDDLFGTGSHKTAKKSEPMDQKISTMEKEVSLFEDSETFEPIKKTVGKVASPKPIRKVKDSIFEDSESSDQESFADTKPTVPSLVPKSKPEKSLFDDDDDEDDDIFSQVKKKVPSAMKKDASAEQTKGISMFDEPQKIAEKSGDSAKNIEPELFGDISKQVKKVPSALKQDTSVEQTKGISIFDEPQKVNKKVPLAVTKDTSAEQTKGISIFDEPQKIAEKSRDLAKNIKPELFGDDSIQVSAPNTQKKAHDDKSKSLPLNTEESGIDFDVPINSTKTLNVLSKDRVKGATKRRLPSRKGRTAMLEAPHVEEEISEEVPKEDPKPPLSHKAQEKKKMDLMSQLMSEVSASKVAKKTAAEEQDVDIFAEAASEDQEKKYSFSFLPSAGSGTDSQPSTETKENAKADDWENDEFFAEPSFKNFRSSVSRADSVLALSDDDDLFSPLKTESLPKPKSDAGDLFDDDSDIFADIQKEKYELFPSQLYDDEDAEDDIFGTLEPQSGAEKTKVVKKMEKEPVNAFDDPLTGLLGEE